MWEIICFVRFFTNSTKVGLNYIFDKASGYILKILSQLPQLPSEQWSTAIGPTTPF